MPLLARKARVANAYFIPDDLCRQMLADASRRGVKVEIIVPGPDLDQQIVRKVGRSRWGPLFDAGARFFEYQPARFHCKALERRGELERARRTICHGTRANIRSR